MLVFIAGLAVAFLVFRSLGAQRSGGILRRAFWCCYVLWAALVAYGLVYSPWKAIRAQDETFASAKKANADWLDQNAPQSVSQSPGATFTPPPLSSYRGDAPEDQPSPIEWALVIALLAGPLVLWYALIYIVRGRLW